MGLGLVEYIVYFILVVDVFEWYFFDWCVGDDEFVELFCVYFFLWLVECF